MKLFFYWWLVLFGGCYMIKAYTTSQYGELGFFCAMVAMGLSLLTKELKKNDT